MGVLFCVICSVLVASGVGIVSLWLSPGGSLADTRLLVYISGVFILICCIILDNLSWIVYI